jgi:hypothetical protein
MSERQTARADAENAEGLRNPVPKRKDLMDAFRKIVGPVKKQP